MKTLDVEQQLRDAIAAGDPDEIQRLGEMLDLADAERVEPMLASSALWYASAGLRVFPLQPRSKIPFKGSKGCHDATADPDRIRAWWKADPDANVAIATGHVVDVIDVDGPAGNASLARRLLVRPTVADPYHDIPVVGVVSTPRLGGRHLYVEATGQGNGAGLLPGVDYRGLGGYVVAPPSVGADGTPYIWTRPLSLGAAT